MCYTLLQDYLFGGHSKVITNKDLIDYFEKHGEWLSLKLEITKNEYVYEFTLELGGV